MKPQRTFSTFVATLASLMLLTACATSAPPPEVVAQYTQSQPPLQNQHGWTEFTPSEDTRIVYVSDDGNDRSAEVYRRDDPALGADPRQPQGEIKAFKTFNAAFKKTRDGYPDWVLLKRGDTFHGKVAVRNGRSSEAPFLLASYGDDDDLPLVKAGAERAIKICCESFNDIAIQGIDFYAHTRNFDSPEFESTEGGSGISVFVKEGHSGKGLLVEGNKFRFFTGNAVQTEGELTDAVFRRNLILDNYSTSGHSQGLFARNVSMTVEENIFDHNGWYKQQQSGRLDNREGGQATMFNHNTYFQDTHDVVFRNNIFIRPASIGNKWTANGGEASTRNIEIANNLYIDGEIGISMGGNKSGPLRFKNITVRDNVLLDIGRSKPTDRDFAWYLDVRDWDGGEITGNTFVHPGSKSTNNIWAIEISGVTRGVDINQNLIYGFGNGQAISVEEDVKLDNIRIANNRFQLHKSGRNFVKAKETVRGIQFANNHYASEPGAKNQFRIDGASLTSARWQAQTGEKTAEFGRTDNLNAERLIEQYHAAAGHTDSFKHFISVLRSQSYHQWNPDYTAQSINDWIRQQLTPSPKGDIAQQGD